MAWLMASQPVGHSVLSAVTDRCGGHAVFRAGFRWCRSPVPA